MTRTGPARCDRNRATGRSDGATTSPGYAGTACPGWAGGCGAPPAAATGAPNARNWPPWNRHTPMADLVRDEASGADGVDNGATRTRRYVGAMRTRPYVGATRTRRYVGATRTGRYE